MPALGVNIDHVATIRQARRTIEPDPVWAAALAELGATVDVPSSTSRLWLLQPDGRTDIQTSIHPTVDLRVAALEEC